MKNLLKLIVIFLFLGFASCKNNPESKSNLSNESIQEDSLYNELMAVHDEMMPKMQDIMNLKSELSPIADSLSSIDSLSTKAIHQTISDLENADKAMMGWMHQFNPNMDSLSHTERMTYLTHQKAKMDSVKIVMQTAIEDGNGLLETMPLSD